MDSEAVKLTKPASCDEGETDLLKIKNSLSINIVAKTLMEKEKLTPNQKEELKETIISKIDRQFLPNFSNDSQVLPIVASRFAA